jgi:hypothetical protein
MNARILLAAACVLSGGRAAAGKPIAWDAAFSTAGAPARLYLRARYRDAGGHEHRWRVWRDGERRLRRDTDDQLELIVERADDRDDRYRVIDRGRHLQYQARRSNLFRLGAFPDWTQLATLLVRPRSATTVVAAERARLPAGACRWYDVLGDGPPRRVCWSDRWRLPLAVTERGRPVITVDEVRGDVDVDARVFEPPAGVTEIDVDRDLTD